ncbi:MAG TPA: hypothetical protein VFW47_14580 [Phenylobacterium sp.]|nr:hypothetical protein [Phenylobacterium sp.]
MTSHSPPPARAGVRAPVRYSPELGREICARLAAGVSQKALSAEPGMPSAWTMRDWARRIPEFATAFEAARGVSQARQLAQERRADETRRWRRMLKRSGRRGGRVSIRTHELTQAICARIAAGETVVSIGADPAMPAASTICGWVRSDDDFREMYARAKDAAADLLFDLALEIALESSDETVRADRLRIQTLRWHTAMLAPKKYGVRRALAPESDGEGREPWTVVIQRFGGPEDGAKQIADHAGEPPLRSAPGGPPSGA